MYICFYSGLKLSLTGGVCVVPLRSQAAAYLHCGEASRVLICMMALNTSPARRTPVLYSWGGPSQVFHLDVGLRKHLLKPP